MSGRRRAARGVAVLVAATLLLPGCDGSAARQTPAPADEGTAAGAGLSAELLQYRRDEALRQLQVKVANDGEREVVVERLEVDLPGFSRSPAVEPRTALAPGRRVDLPVALGAALCDAGPPPSPPAPRVRLLLEGADRAVELSPTGEALVGQLWLEECAQREVSAAVTIAFADGWSRTGAGDELAVSGVLHATPTDPAVAPGAQARLVRLDGTTLFGVTTGVPLPVVLDRAVDVPVTVRPQRCDPHAVAESKRGYAFRVGVSLGGQEPVLVTVEVPQEQRPVLEDALMERCGLG